MTSYQNVSESQISGYNDCPILDYSQKNSSTSSLNKNRARRLVSHNYSSADMISRTSSPSIQTPPLVPTKSFSNSPIPLSKTASPEIGKSTTEEETIDVTDSLLLEHLQNVLKLPSSLQAREFDHYSKRLYEVFSKGLDNEKYRQIAWKSLNDYKDQKQVKNDLINFMLKNDGSSTWCLPLRKILENVVL